MQLIQDYSKRILDKQFEIGDFNHEKFKVKCSRLRQGFKRAIIYQDNSHWTVIRKKSLDVFYVSKYRL